MPTSVEVITIRLAEAEAAYHDLMMTGAVKTVVDQNGERIEFSVANSARLAAYIAYLKGLLGQDFPGPMIVFM